MENTKTNTVLDYCNDVFFKYTLSREDEDSAYTRNAIIERVTGIKIKEGTIQNSNLDSGTIGKKRTILNVYVKDEKGHFFNLEIQAICAGVAEVMCFEFYEVRALNNQLDSDGKYKDLKPVYRIILIEECVRNSKNLINHYRIRSEQGGDGSEHPLIRGTYIYLPAIGEAARKKAIQRTDDPEQLRLLFESSAKNDILESKERLAKVLVNKYREAQKDDELWLAVIATQMGETRYRYGLEDNFEEGMKEDIIKGKAEGKFEGERQLLHRLMEAKFQEDYTAQLQSLTEDQLHIVSNLLLECDTLEELKNCMETILDNTSK